MGSSLRVEVEEAYGNRLRVRVGALVFDDPVSPSAVLLVEHRGVHSAEPFWTPAGGEVEFGEGLTEALQREVREEASLDVEIGPLRYVLDFVRPPLHTVSFYFEATSTGGAPRVGTDPELRGNQLILSVQFVPFHDLASLLVYPEGLTGLLPSDATEGFPAGIRYLGTLR